MRNLCEFCGAYSPRQCELREEMDDACPWEEMMDSEPDVDLRGEVREEDRRLARENDRFERAES